MKLLPLLLALVLALTTAPIANAANTFTLNITTNGATVRAMVTYKNGSSRLATPTKTDTPSVRSFFIGSESTAVTVTVPAGKKLAGWSGDTTCGTDLTCVFPYEAKNRNVALTFADKPVPAINEILFNNVSAQVLASTPVAYGTPIVVSGKTTPNARVTLYIQSKASEPEVIAGKDGAWTYEIEDLEAGNHTVFAVITDPTTGNMTDKTLLAKFSVSQPQVSNTEVASATKSNTTNPLPYVIAAIGIVTASIAIAVLVVIRRKRAVSKSQTAFNSFK